MGTVELGVVAAAWSPEEAVLAVVTGMRDPMAMVVLHAPSFTRAFFHTRPLSLSASNTLLLLGNTFEPLCETDLHTADFGAAAPVNVGWGKKETQFHGMAGKAAAQADNSKRSVHLAENDNLRPCVSWRGDGAFFSVSSVRPDGGMK